MTQEDSPKSNELDDIQKILNLKRKTSSSTKWAMGLTGVWAVVVLILGYLKWPELVCMPPNEWGDFLAGTFSPLALLWLVAGYRQQGDELFLNTKALLMQQVEMKNQVKEFKKLAVHAGEQAASSAEMVRFSRQEKEAKEIAAIEPIEPKFEFRMVSVLGYQWALNITNKGAEVHDVMVSTDAFKICEFVQVRSWHFDEKNMVRFNELCEGSNADHFFVTMSYTNLKGERRELSYELKGNKHYPVGFSKLK